MNQFEFSGELKKKVNGSFHMQRFMGKNACYMYMCLVDAGNLRKIEGISKMMNIADVQIFMQNFLNSLFIDFCNYFDAESSVTSKDFFYSLNIVTCP